MKKKIFAGSLLIIAAVALIFDAGGVFIGVPTYRVLLGIICAVWFAKELTKLHISGIFFPAAFIFLLFEKYIARMTFGGKNIISNWVVLIAALIFTVGTEIIFGDLVIGKKIRGHLVSSKTSNRFAEGVKYIDCATLGSAVVKNSFGEMDVYFQNNEAFDNGCLIVNNSFGEMNIHVPAEFKVETDVKNKFGEINLNGEGAADGNVLRIEGSSAFGELNVIFE